MHFHRRVLEKMASLLIIGFHLAFLHIIEINEYVEITT
jgi:hypothetical protein